jgi:prepilin-type processing-associated H-X9-DG protein
MSKNQKPICKGNVMKTEKAFSIIELMVVGVIAAVLLAILLPAGAQMRESAREASCAMNMFQLGICFDMYTKDNDTFFTDGTKATHNIDPSTFGGIGDWMTALDGGYKFEQNMTQAQIDQTRDMHRGLSYLKDYELLVCPMATTASIDVPAKFRAWGGGPRKEDMGIMGNAYLPYNGSAVGSYGHNYWCNNVPAPVVMRWQTQPTAWCWRTTAVENAFEVPVLTDCSRWAAAPQAVDTPPAYDGEYGGTGFYEIKRVCIDRHDGAVNILYMDWSVRRAPLKTLWNIKWHRNWDEELAQAGGPPDPWPAWMQDF